MHRRRLLTLLIHRRTREQYKRDHDKFVAKQKRLLEALRGQPFDALPHERQVDYLDRWFWPPWRFNDLAGFAEIELETPWTVIGHMDLPEGRVAAATKKPLLLDYACTTANCEENDERSLRTAIIDVAKQLQQQLSKRKWRLEFDSAMLEYTDFLSTVAVNEEDLRS